MANQPQPSQGEIQALIQRLNQGQFAATESQAKALIEKHANVFILHHIMALALDGQSKFSASIAHYQKAIQLNPKQADLYFNLGIAFSTVGQLDSAIQAYQQATTLNPQFFEAFGNLGTVYQQIGDLDAAVNCYQKGLAINPQDARGHFNLGTALRDQGQLPAAIKHYEQAIKLFPNYTDAYNNLGEALRDHGDMQGAVKQYQTALSLNPSHPNANYNMGEFLYLAKDYAKAVEHFDASGFEDWQARAMYSLYKGRQFEEFKQRLDKLSTESRHLSPLIATLATHYAVNFDTQNQYQFCPEPLDFVYHTSIKALSDPNNSLLSSLLNDIETAEIAERVQGMLHYGKQSAGNLFKRPESSFQSLGKLVLAAFAEYKENFRGANCELIEAFPDNLDFTSSWYVKMSKGGHLSPHIHEIGWISGAVYLAMPETNGLEGAFEFGTHGDDYPIQDGKTIESFPKSHVLPQVGDIVLFPSSLFHRTVPFSSDSTRICIAFDLKPTMR